jgi:hypothetical protein
VTATLRNVLQESLSEDGLSGTITVGRPDSTSANGAAGVRLFLYQIMWNAVNRNADLPSRRGDGSLVQRPRAALDLHYLLSFTGDESDFEPEQLLGSVVRKLHTEPLLSREKVEKVIQDYATILGGSDLPYDIDIVRCTPLSLSLEELSRIWSIFYQIPYSLSVAYEASVVFVEGSDTPQTAMPVRDRQLFVVPFQQPFIENVVPQIIASGATMTISGQNLRGDVTKLKFGAALAMPATVTANKITVPVPGTLQPGVRTVQVIQDLDFGTGIPGNEPHRGFESNVAPFILQPSITTAPPFTVARGATFTLAFAPPIGREQSVALLLNSDTNNYTIPRNTWRPPDPLPPPTATSLDFKIPTSVVTGDYFLRVRMDGAESALEVDANTLEYNGPKITIT